MKVTWSSLLTPAAAGAGGRGGRATYPRVRGLAPRVLDGEAPPPEKLLELLLMVRYAPYKPTTRAFNRKRRAACYYLQCAVSATFALLQCSGAAHCTGSEHKTPFFSKSENLKPPCFQKEQQQHSNSRRPKVLHNPAFLGPPKHLKN